MTAQALRRCRRFQQRQSLPSLNLGGDITTSSKGGFRADNAGIQYYQNHNQKQHRSQQHRNRCTIAPFYRSSLSSTTAALGEGSFSASLSSSSSSLAGFQQKRHFWNPFTSKTGTGGAVVRDNNAVVGSARTKSEDETEQPRKIQERKDLTLLMLALEFHKIAAEEDRRRHEKAESEHENENENESNVSSSSSSSTGNEYLENREKMIDMAFDRLEDIEIDKKTMMQLRYALQEAMEDQVIELFNAFASIDEELLLLVPDSDVSTNGSDRAADVDIEFYLDEILRLEFERTIDELANTKQSRAPKGADPKYFLTLKRGAIETLLRQRDGKQQQRRQDPSPDAPGSANSPQTMSWSEADQFGYHASIDDERNQLIRYYQSINLCRSAKMRDKVGYSVVALQSSIPGAGRGVYVDGYARAGSILAFQPGPVWAKESLVNLSVEEERDLERNDAYQMSLRADDYMIDSRRSPYTVLTDENSNLMALGHIVNHPSPMNPPSCRSAMLNFTQGMELGSSKKFKRYIPNTYARPRNVTLMDSLWDRDVIEMHSMVLVATRDICNEEIFYDYRLSSSHHPQWYHQVHDTAYEAPDSMDDDSDGDK
eukprot:CAMPEP_0172360156 /NCGR_PEP_ID=MMETSP1060-20121228/4233_1 /TAXON_ID=37318 /ORGANISM="Pseudo-nitzschia pungens, Strain cf. cingulata" /LENGTH=597 /DNA_ID=CAMNT_0013082069 /DNA_START=184 /DNA_END=1974 /DNA_ORIENTATION=+